jgi:hypothetical protein
MPDTKNTPSPASPPKTTEKTVETPTEPKEIGGRKEGKEPTRYNDWEKAGRCIDF